MNCDVARPVRTEPTVVVIHLWSCTSLYCEKWCPGEVCVRVCVCVCVHMLRYYSAAVCSVTGLALCAVMGMTLLCY